MENDIEKDSSKKVTKFYGPADRPPWVLTIFSSIQHMLLVISLGLALPVTVARTAQLSAGDAGTFLSIALLTIGITGILQTLPSKYLGNGRMDLSTSDSAAISACTFAAALGGMPLVFGMTIFSGIVKTILGSFIYRFRKLFPPEVTGTMIFILGISIIPTGMKYLLGVQYFNTHGTFSFNHLFVAVVTLLLILSCSIFSEKLRPYAVLLGLVVGFILSGCFGLLDKEGFSELTKTAIFSLPIPQKIELAFDWRAVIPFMIVTIAAIVDNIGDYTAAQKISDPNFKKPDWGCIESGVRASGLGSIFAGFAGGVIQSTATANIGIASATGVTSRIVGYMASILLILLAFFPRMMGALMLIPEPVLGAILVFSMIYIMAGGFSTLASIELDERRIFVIFTSIIFATSTMIPQLWIFMPNELAQIILSPLVMGTAILLFMTLFTNLGTVRQVKFDTKVDANAIKPLNDKIKKICQKWCVSKQLCSSLTFGIDAVAESLAISGVDNEVKISLQYDRMQIKLRLVANHPNIPELNTAQDKKIPSEMDIALLILNNRFDNVFYKKKGDVLTIDVDVDF